MVWGRVCAMRGRGLAGVSARCICGVWVSLGARACVGGFLIS